MAVPGWFVFTCQHVLQMALFIDGQPRGCRQVVLEIVERNNAEQDGGCALNREHPLPAVNAQDPVHASHNPARYQATQHASYSDARIENRQCTSTTPRRKPKG